MRRIRRHPDCFAVSGNFRSLLLVLERVKRSWYEWLCRRSQRTRLTWERFADSLRVDPLRKPRIGVRIRGAWPRAACVEESDGGNLLLRIWREPAVADDHRQLDRGLVPSLRQRHSGRPAVGGAFSGRSGSLAGVVGAIRSHARRRSMRPGSRAPPRSMHPDLEDMVRRCPGDPIPQESRMSTRLRSIDQAAVAPLSSRPSLSTPSAVCAAFCGAAAIAIGCNAGRPARPRRPSRGGGDERRRQLRAARPPRRRLREVRPLPEGSGPGRCRLHVLDREGGDLILPLRRPRRPAVGGRAARRPPPRSRRPATGASEPGGRPRRDRAASVQPFVVRARRRVCRASLFLIRAARAGEVACVS